MRKILLLLPFFLWTCGGGGGGGSTEPEPPQLPTVTNIEVTTLEDTAKTFALTGTDPNNLALTYSISTQPQHGTISISGGAATYSPNANYHGQDVIAFLASSTNGNSNIGTIIITITPVDDEPNTMDVTATTDEDNSVTINLEAEEFDGDSIEFQVRNNPSNGTVTISGTTATYTPNQDWYGTDTFNFEAIDSNARTILNVATGTIVVNPINDAPTVENINDIETKRTKEIEIELLGTDIENDNLSYQIVTNPSFGNVSIEGNKLLFSANDTGNVSIEYKANDGNLDSVDNATISISISTLSETYGSTEGTHAYKAIETSQNNLMIVGFTGTSETSNTAIYIAKTDIFTNLIWEKTFDYYGNDSGYDIIELADGNFLITGRAQETINNNTSAILIKIDNDGNEIWKKFYENNDSTEAFTVKELDNQNIFIAGSSGPPASDDAWMQIVDSSGNEILENSISISGSEDYVFDSKILNDGNILITGYTSKNSGNIFLAKLDLNLNVLFTKEYGTNNAFDTARSSVELNNGDILTVGLTGNMFSSRAYDAFLLKTDSQGNEIFFNNLLASQQSSTYEGANSIISIDDGNFLIAGYKRDSGFLLIKIDDSGNEIWTKTYGSGNDDARSVIQTSDGDFVLVGTGNTTQIMLVKVNSVGNRIN